MLHQQPFWRPMVALLMLLTTNSISRGDWTSFRSGGSSEVTSSIPSKWSPAEGIAWQHELPGYGQSTPVILGDKVFVTAADGPMKERLLVMCYALDSGELLWRHETIASTQAASNYMAARAAPTPVVDPLAIYAFFESGDCVAVDHGGKILWHRSLTTDYGQFDNNHGLGSSPAQNASHVFINVEHKGPSYLIALDKRSGKTTWKVERDSTSSWSSPIVVSLGTQEHVIVSSGGSVSSYDTASGEVRWTVPGLDGNSVPSPTLSGTKLFIGARLPEFAEEGSIRSNCCIDVSKVEPQVVWRAEKAISDYASPVLAGDCAYFVNKAGVLYCLDAASGKVHYAHRLGTQCWSTPIVADSFIYFFGKDGKTQVLKASPQFELVASNNLWSEDNPPKPETYAEHSSHEHGASKGAGDGAAGKPGASSSGRAPGGGMLNSLLKADANGDGSISAEEIPADFKTMLPRVDTNRDGSLDASEIKAMADSFASRRADSQSAARDPIVYGAAASAGKIVIRTGTRLYCIQ